MVNPTPRSEDSDTAGRRDRRRPRRVASRAHAEVTPVPDGETIEAYAFAIGLDGAGLACCTPLAVGQPVSLIFCFTTRAGAAAREGPLLGRTTSLHFDDDVAIIGVEFAERLSRRTSPALLRAIAQWRRSSS